MPYDARIDGSSIHASYGIGCNQLSHDDSTARARENRLQQFHLIRMNAALLLLLPMPLPAELGLSRCLH